MPKSNLPKGVHRVRRKVVNGVRYHFYAWRGGPKFWEGTAPSPKEPEFFHAFSECGKPSIAGAYLTTQLVDDFLSSASLPKAERSKADIRKWLELFRVEFGADPVAMFEARASRGEVNNWRKKWLHSPKQHDMAGTHATRILNWAVEEGKLKSITVTSSRNFINRTEQRSSGRGAISTSSIVMRRIGCSESYRQVAKRV